VFLDTTSEGIYAWAFGVAHDEGILDVVAPKTDDAVVAAVTERGFEMTTFEGVYTCSTSPGCTLRYPGIPRGGWISRVLLSPTQTAALPLGRNPVARATYLLDEPPGPQGTPIEFSDRLEIPGQDLPQFGCKLPH
jgi:hypothetical protein